MSEGVDQVEVCDKGKLPRIAAQLIAHTLKEKGSVEANTLGSVRLSNGSAVGGGERRTVLRRQGLLRRHFDSRD